MKKHCLTVFAVSSIFVAGFAFAGEPARSEFDQLPSSLVVYELLTEMKTRYSMEGSKALWRFINPETCRLQNIKTEEASVNTILVVAIHDIRESVRGDVVTAVVESEELPIEILTFNISLAGGKALVALNDEVNSSFPRVTPWSVRVATKRLPPEIPIPGLIKK